MSFWLSSAALVPGGQILPEQAMVEMATAVEVDEWLESNHGCNILL